MGVSKLFHGGVTMYTRQSDLRVELKPAVAFIGDSQQAKEARKFVEMAGETDQTVLLQGETGTGKDLLAILIHNKRGQNKPFVPVNCGAVAEGLLESELFGHTEGAFTSAKKSTKGLVQVANAGTLFLNEIGEMPLNLQVKLLGVLEEDSFRPVGSTQTTQVNTRFIVATNTDLDLALRQGKFRQDLYFRINVLSFVVPSLRQRKEDIPLLVDHFLSQESVPKLFNLRTMAKMMEYDWPGNIRELKNAVRRAVVFSGKATEILPEYVEPYLKVVGKKKAVSPTPDFKTSLSCDTPSTGQWKPLSQEFERQYYLHLLGICAGNIHKVSRASGISLKTIYRKLKKLGLEEELRLSRPQLN